MNVRYRYLHLTHTLPTTTVDIDEAMYKVKDPHECCVPRCAAFEQHVDSEQEKTTKEGGGQVLLTDLMISSIQALT